MTDRSDADLVRDVAARRDGDAFTELHQRHARRLIAVAARVVHDRSVAEEVAHDVLFDLWQRPRRFDPERGSVAALLTVQVRSRAIDRTRSDDSRRSREDRQGTDRSLDTRQPALDATDRATLHAAMGAMEEEHRGPIELAFFHGYSYREVAVVLGLAEGTVKSRIRRGLGLLRTRLLELDPHLVPLSA